MPKIKIIREIKPKIREIKKEEKKAKENLEGEVESLDSKDFAEFVSSSGKTGNRRIAPVLESEEPVVSEPTARTRQTAPQQEAPVSYVPQRQTGQTAKELEKKYNPSIERRGSPNEPIPLARERQGNAITRNPQMEALGGQGEKEYKELKQQEKKETRRYPWES